MESIFNGWERITPYSDGSGHSHSTLGNHISICVTKADTKYPQYKLNVGKELIQEIGRTRFSLYKKGNVYALVPNNHGEFIKNINNHNNYMKGFSKKMIVDIAESIGINPNDRPKIKAKVIGGAIVFPSDSFEQDTL